MSLKKHFASEVTEALKRYLKPGILTEQDICHLPEVVQKYIRYAGCIGKEKTWNFRAVFEGEMKLDEKQDWIKIHSEQYNFFDSPSRFFHITASMKGMPVTGLHVYKNATATMQIKLAGMITVADARGPKMDQGETVTVLNDMCLMAPASLISPDISWEPIDDLSVRASFNNAGIRISARLAFNASGELANFMSDDRFLSKDGKTYESLPWSTPMGEYQEFDGRKVPASGETTWHYPDHQYCYGKFWLKEIEFNIPELKLL
jgi:hypothetical protein